MDSSSNSSPNPPGGLDHLERPLPPLPNSELDIATHGDDPRDLDLSEGMPRTEPSINIATTQPQHISLSLSGGEIYGARHETTVQSSNARSRSQSSSSSSLQRSIYATQRDISAQSFTLATNEALYGSGESHLLSRTSSIHGSGVARSARLGGNAGESTSRSRSHSQTLVQALQLQLPLPPAARTSPSDSDSDETYRELPLLSHDSPNQIRRIQRHAREPEPARAEFVVPRWQPDAEVTMCPICRTQFSFFVRKHHCRKCGRVVCSSCSPHRITIPYQYIVQPPTEGAPASGGPYAQSPAESMRIASSTQVGNAEGGERVRLCNPCVPDPNTAPPQTLVPHLRQPSQRSHSRSASTATASYNNPGNYRSREEIERLITSFPRHPREPSVLGGHPTPSNNSGRGTLHMDGEDRSIRPLPPDNRSRSSTVGGFREPSNMQGQFMGLANPFPSRSASNAQPPYRPLISRAEDNNSRAMSSRQRHAQRPNIPEEDECWICHWELPSRTLDNFEKLREEHVEACLTAAMHGISVSPVPSARNSQAPTRIPSNHGESSSSTAQPHASSSSSSTGIPAPVGNTPEARMAAREQAHAAVVFGRSQPSSPGPSRRTGVFPYQATEKDCVDDAECTICLEEFIIGEDMGRLECFCRFHLRCIRQWFENHPGQCPVHQHGAGY